jgi:AraC-like DNA-binding protein
MQSSKPTMGMPSTDTGTISFSSSLVNWHNMICDSPVAPERVGNDICFLDSKISPKVGRGMLDLVTFDEDFILLNMRGHFHDPISYRIVGEGWTRLHFRKAARTTMDFDGIGQSDLEGPLCQILHQPVGVGDEEWIEGGAHLDWVTLCMRPNLLIDRFKLDSIRLNDPVRRLAKGADDFLLTNWSLSAEMSRALNQLLNVSYAGDLKRVHLEAKALELICLMSDVMSERPDSAPVRLTPADVERLHEVRSLLSRSFADCPSIMDLSRKVGINRNKLSYGFRHLFKTTISDFCHENRMQAGWELLRESTLPISIVAENAGYAQTPAFSNAFKKRFGISPRQARQGISPFLQK